MNEDQVITSEPETDPVAFSLFSDFDINLFRAGRHYRLYDKLGSHVLSAAQTGSSAGTYFAVYAPNAGAVSVTGDFNGWSRLTHPMSVRWDGSGIWELFVPGLGAGSCYKYFIHGADGYEAEKADPYAVFAEQSPGNASIIHTADHQWQDAAWMARRGASDPLKQPVSVYELHIGSWRRPGDDPARLLSYRELAVLLPAYCADMGFTHVELMPVMEHPFYGSWGYQVTGYFAASSRYGRPEDLKFLVDELHHAGIGVLLDWVPSHFPADTFGLAFFDGTHLYEHAGSRGFHPDWQSCIFNLGRHEIRAFLISSALYWLDQYHIDGLRVDAVASMLYLDYSRQPGDWQPNQFGGREDLDAVSFLQELNEAVHRYYPGTLMIAEESTAWPGVTHPVAEGGLGFDMKWMMGWMHDTLHYFGRDPLYRKHHHAELTFGFYYGFDERFMLPLSHDEVVYGKGSMQRKMPGDEQQRFAQLRLLYAYMFLHPGAKLLFMGNEWGQYGEWRHDFSLDWHELEGTGPQRGLQLLVRDLNRLYATAPSLYQLQFSTAGFRWIDYQDAGQSVLCWIRQGEAPGDRLLVVAHFTPEVLNNYRVGVPAAGAYRLLLDTASATYGGSGTPAASRLSYPVPKHGYPQSLCLSLPAFSVQVFQMP